MARVLDHGNELDELGAHAHPAKKRYHTRSVIAISRVHCGQHIPVDAVLLQEIQPRRITRLKGPLASLVDTIGIVDVARTVDGDSDQEVVLFEEGTPLAFQGGFRWSAGYSVCSARVWRRFSAAP